LEPTVNQANRPGSARTERISPSFPVRRIARNWRRARSLPATVEPQLRRLGIDADDARETVEDRGASPPPEQPVASKRKTEGRKRKRRTSQSSHSCGTARAADTPCATYVSSKQRKKSQTVAAKLPESLIADLDRIAQFRCVTRSFVIRKLVEAAVGAG
jgi:hypothetical protein